MPNRERYLDLENEVYGNMRNKLVHVYSTKGFGYSDEFPERHLRASDSVGMWIHVETFVDEVETAAESYLVDLRRSDEMWKRFMKKYNRDPLLRPVADD